MSTQIGLVIEGLVAILLMITIAYCILLNRRLTRLKADEQALKATISELITATEIAERAIAGLKITVQECDHNLGHRLKAADAASSDLARQTTGAEQLVAKLAQIVGVGRLGETAGPHPVAIVPDASATVAAAQAFAARARTRAQSAAA